MASSALVSDFVGVKCADGAEFEIPMDVALMSPTLTNILRERAKNEEQSGGKRKVSADPARIHLRSVPSAGLGKALEYCTYHEKNLMTARKERMLWNLKFVDDDVQTLCELATASYYLAIQPLVDLSARALAIKMSGKKAPELRKMFNIQAAQASPEGGPIFLDDTGGNKGEKIKSLGNGSTEKLGEEADLAGDDLPKGFVRDGAGLVSIDPASEMKRATVRATRAKSDSGDGEEIVSGEVGAMSLGMDGGARRLDGRSVDDLMEFIGETSAEKKSSAEGDTLSKKQRKKMRQREKKRLLEAEKLRMAKEKAEAKAMAEEKKRRKEDLKRKIKEGSDINSLDIDLDEIFDESLFDDEDIEKDGNDELMAFAARLASPFAPELSESSVSV